MRSLFHGKLCSKLTYFYQILKIGFQNFNLGVIERTQDRATLATTGAWNCSNRNKLYE